MRRSVSAKCKQSRQSKSIGFRLIMHQRTINALKKAKMKPTFTDQAVRCFAARIVTSVAVLSSVFLSVAFAQTSAQSPPAASQTDPPPSATDARRQAPIGHRQTRPGDLPSNVRRDENGVVLSPSDRELDQMLQICRNC
jgi:hypothetical protein